LSPKTKRFDELRYFFTLLSPFKEAESELNQLEGDNPNCEMDDAHLNALFLKAKPINHSS